MQVARQPARPPVAHGPPVHLHHGHRPGDGVGEHDLAGRPPGVLGERLLPRRHRLQHPRPRDPAQQPRRRRRHHLVADGAEGVAQGRLPQAAVRVQQERVVGAGRRRGPLRATGPGVGEALVLRARVPRRPRPAQARSRARPGGSRPGAPRAPPPRAGWDAGVAVSRTRPGPSPMAASAAATAARARSRPGMGLRSSARAASASRSRWRSSSAHAPALGAHRLEEALTPAHRRVVDRERRCRRVHQSPVEPDHPVCDNARRVPGRRSRSVHAADGTKGTRRVA